MFYNSFEIINRSSVAFTLWCSFRAEFVVCELLVTCTFMVIYTVLCPSYCACWHNCYMSDLYSAVVLPNLYSTVTVLN